MLKRIFNDSITEEQIIKIISVTIVKIIDNKLTNTSLN